jgi:hypothetical protein
MLRRHNCKTALGSNRERYCPSHHHLHSVCALIGRNEPVVMGKKTCIAPEHQEVERVHIERGQAQFQLKERLKRAQVAHPNDAMTRENDAIIVDEELEQSFHLDQHGRVLLDDNPQPQLIPTKKEIKAQFGRRRTHNEQIIVAPCGTILARETFYGAEAVSTAAVSVAYLSFHSANGPLSTRK